MNIKFINRAVPSLHAAALILGGAAFLSRILGLLRDRLLANRFGAGDVLDAYYAAFQIPDILFTIFLVGAASAAVMPIFMEYDERGQGTSAKFASNLLSVFVIFSLALALLTAIFAPGVMSLVAPGFGPGKLQLAVKFTRLIILNAVFFGIGGILSSVLQARHRFFVFALPPILYNAGIIAGIIFLVPLVGPIGLAVGVLIGGVMQVAVQLPALKSMGFKFIPQFNLGEPGLIRVARISAPRVLALAMSQITLVVLAAIASFFAAGSLSVFKLSSNLMYVPVGLFGVSYALAIFPKLSGASLAGHGAKFSAQFSAGVRNILFWALPFATLFIVLRAHVVRVVLGSGVFDWEDTRLVAALLGVLAVAVVSESILPLVMRAFYALGHTKEPLIWDIIGSLGVIVLAVGFAALASARPELLQNLARILRIGDLAPPKILAVALGFAIGSLINAVLLYLALRRTVKKNLGTSLEFDGHSALTMLAAAILGGLGAYATLLPFPALLATNTFIGIFLQGASAGAVGFAIYFAVLVWQKNAEVMEVIQSFKRRLFSPRKNLQVYEAERLDGEGTGR